ncbi:MAG: hypothetical protein ACI4J1_11990 [Ruminiclostridium sp.]
MIWILTQDGKKLVYCSGFEISKNLGGRNKASITAYRVGESSLTLVTAGLYETEDKARDELDRIIEFIQSGKGGVYKMN